MATLPTEDKSKIWRGLMRWWSSLQEVTPFSKAELLSAINNTDQWIDDNTSSYNSSLPITFRTNATLAQKTLLFCAVALARVSITFLRKVFGEVD